MRFEPNPNFEREMRAQILRNLERLRPTLQGVECPDHTGQHPDLIRQGNELRIAACCKVAATLASTKAGFGDVTWQEGPEAGQEGPAVQNPNRDVLIEGPRIELKRRGDR